MDWEICLFRGLIFRLADENEPRGPFQDEKSKKFRKGAIIVLMLIRIKL